MGSKKSGLREGVHEGQEVGREAVESGEQLKCDGSEIRRLLDSIDTSMDEDDVAAVREADSGYGGDFRAEFSDSVDTREAEMERIEGEVSDSAAEERDRVMDSAERFAEMAAVTDVGRRNAEGAEAQMESSAAEYEGFMREAAAVIEETQAEVASLRSAVDSLFS